MTTPKKKSKKKKITSVGGSSKKTKSVTDVVSSKAPVSEPSKPSLHRRGSSLEGTDGTGTSRSDSIRDENLGEKQKSLDGKSSGTNLLNENDRSGSSKTKLVTNVQVCARIRPLHCHSESTEGEKTVKSSSRQVNSKKKKSKVSSSSSQEDDTFVAWDISEDNSSASQSSKTEKVHGRTHSYTLDRVFGTDATTDQIYHESVASLVKAAMEGYNSTVLAYGQTSTGKTHTMTGQRDDTGIVPLCVNDCFKYVRENASDEPREYLFRFSYLEIYKEHIRDLLSSTTSAPEPVRLFDKSDGLIIRGLKEVVVSSPNKVFQLLKQGDKRRQVGATHMNRHSSRSHVVARLKIESSSAKGKGDETRVSILSLVDLAGSESVRLNGAQRREEGQYINKSLMALGQVVLGLSESSKSKGEKKKKKKHIPYRDSKLTRLLQSSLSGNAQLLMMCCISPLASHLEESHNTFKFATRAKRIKQKASIHTAKDKEETLLQTYRNEIEDLRQQLAEATIQKQQLLEEQQALKTIKNREEWPPENIDVAAASMTSPTLSVSKTHSNTVESTTGEIEELVEAIQTMEQLILKSRPLQQQNLKGLHPQETIRKNDISSGKKDLDEMLQYDEGVEGDEDLLVENDVNFVGNDSAAISSKSPGRSTTTPRNYRRTPATPISDDHLHSELTRVRGLLSTVLQKRGVSQVPNDHPGVGIIGHEKIRKNLDFSTPTSGDPPSRRIRDESLSELETDEDVDKIVGVMFSDTSKEDEEKKAELESLRKQLKQQERTTSLRKADSHFLQLQLEEKDKLLEEVSSLLEAVEMRQGELERENFALKRELDVLREERGEERGIIISNTPF